MIWLTWRQFRPQWVSTLGAALVLTAATLTLGVLARHAYDALLAGCAQGPTCGGGQVAFDRHYLTPVRLLGLLLQAAPGLIGLFWGAPLIGRELESGSFRLVWTQSVSRRRWLAAKLGVLALVSAAATGLFSLLLTWAARPVDDFSGDRFDKLVFPVRDVAPVGYAVFAFVLGCTFGLLVRRTLPAMALTLLVFAAVQVAMPLGVRPHLLPPKTAHVPVTFATLGNTGGLFLDGGPEAEAKVQNYEIPGAWVLTGTSPLLTSAGHPADAGAVQACMDGADATAGSTPAPGPGPAGAGPCLSRLNLHFDVRYQPADRYWVLQLLETAIFLVLALALAGLCFRIVPRVRA